MMGAAASPHRDHVRFQIGESPATHFLGGRAAAPPPVQSRTRGSYWTSTMSDLYLPHARHGLPAFQFNTREARDSFRMPKYIAARPAFGQAPAKQTAQCSPASRVR
jgi:hypothetical protein